MGRVISRTAAAKRILKDVTETLAVAEATSPRFTSFVPRQKALALELLARGLETDRHRRVPDAEVDEMTTQLRSEAATITDLVVTLEPAVAEGRVLRSQRAATVQLAQRQLAALKRYWVSDGLSEAEIHEIIPSRGRAVRKPSELVEEEQTDETLLDEQGFEGVDAGEDALSEDDELDESEEEALDEAAAK